MFNQFVLMLRMALLRLGIDEEGQDMVEYALIIVVIALVVVLAMPTLTGAISTAYTNIATALGT